MSAMSRSGRTTVVALSVVVVTALLAGGLVSRRADAQTTPPARGIMNIFGVFQLAPATVSEGTRGIIINGGTRALIGLLLPAVNQPAEPYRLQFLNEDTNLLLPAVMPADNTTINWGDTLQMYTVANATAPGYELNVLDERTNRIVASRSTMFNDFTVRLLPAVQKGGLSVPAVAASITLMGANNASFADGSVEPIPFEYALPAVQAPAPAG